jgi:RsmE family RNA methyltransferase
VVFWVRIYYYQKGIQTVTPLITHKVQNIFNEKDIQIFYNKIIAGCELSKQNIITNIETPLKFDNFIKNIDKNNKNKIFFDIDGDKKLNQINIYNENINNEKIIVFIGPEGDVIDSERKLLIKNGFQRIKLTNSILRFNNY